MIRHAKGGVDKALCIWNPYKAGDLMRVSTNFVHVFKKALNFSA